MKELLRDLWSYLMQNKKWWLVPLMITLLLVDSYYSWLQVRLFHLLSILYFKMNRKNNNGEKDSVIAIIIAATPAICVV